jgi:hypothetical protein
MPLGVGSDGELREFTGRRFDAAKDLALGWSREEIRFSAEAVIEQIMDRLHLEPIQIYADQMSRSEIHEVNRTGRDRFGDEMPIFEHRITIQVPVSGEALLLAKRAKAWRHDAADMRVAERYVAFDLTRPSLTAEIIGGHIDETVKHLVEYAGWINADLAEYEQLLRQVVTSAVNARKARLDSAAEAAANLTIPLTPTPTAKQVRLPVQRTRVRVVDLPGGDSQSREPVLEDAVYEDVLRTLGHLARTAERLPRTAAKLKEEELRDLLLFVLNANYDGLARGEVFNFTGRTDILLPYRDRNAFIAECKIWTRPKKFTDAIDQLLGRYAAWRDTKGALILFIKTGDATRIIDTATQLMRQHRAFRVARPSPDPYLRQDLQFVSLLDDQQRIQVALLPIVIPRPIDVPS